MFAIEKVRENLLAICGKTTWLDKEKELFGIACGEILKNEDIRENFTREEIEKMLKKILMKTSQFPEEDRRVTMEEELVKLKESLEGWIKEWILMVPVENLELHQRFLKIGDVKFYTLSNFQKMKLVRLLRSILRGNPHYSQREKREIVRDVTNHCIDPLLKKVCGEIKLKGRLKRVHDLALQRVLDATRVMKLYRHIADDKDGKYFDLMGDIATRATRIVLRYPQDKSQFNPISEVVGILFPYEIDQKKKSLMKRWSLDEISRMLTKSDPTPLERRLLSSIFWCSRACEVHLTKEEKRESIHGQKRKASFTRRTSEQFNLCDRLIKLTIALESLLIFHENEPIQNNVAERSALILGKNYVERKRIKSFIKHVYGLRSQAVHRGWADISKKELDELTVLTQSLILNLLKRKKRLCIYKEEDLFDWFEKKKLGG